MYFNLIVTTNDHNYILINNLLLISCFAHFPTQFVQDVACLEIIIMSDVGK